MSDTQSLSAPSHAPFASTLSSDRGAQCACLCWPHTFPCARPPSHVHPQIAQGLVDVAVAQSAAPFMQDLIKAVAAGLPPGHPRAPSLSLPPAAHVYALPGMWRSCWPRASSTAAVSWSHTQATHTRVPQWVYTFSGCPHLDLAEPLGHAPTAAFWFSVFCRLPRNGSDRAVGSPNASAVRRSGSYLSSSPHLLVATT